MKLNSKIIRLSFMALIVSFAMNVFSQNVARDGKAVKPSAQATKYDRSALSLILMSYPNESHSSKLQSEFPRIEVPSKFDDNTLATQVFTVNGNRTSQTTQASKYLLNTINSSKIGNSIISKWYNRQPDGSFNMDLISQRGLYNATDMDVVNASAKKIGKSALQDSGEKLLDNSYVVVMDYSGIRTSEEGYDANKTAYDKRTSHGWTGNFTAHVYKLNLNDSISSVFYNDLWVNKDDNSNIKAERSAKFESTYFPLSYITSVTGSINSEQAKPGTNAAIFTVQKSDDQLFTELLDKGVENAEYQIAKTYEAFKVKTTVYSTHPIAAKIGKKEGLKVDDRYFVYENKQKRNGDIKAVRKAVVRASNRIIDNRAMATGNSTAVSKFYQIGGKRVDEGMLLKQKNDAGIGIFATYSIGEIGGYGLGVEYLLNKLVHGLPTSLKIIGEVGYETKFYEGEGKGDITFLRYSVGISKSIHFARKFQIEPSFSYGRETTSEGSSTNTDGSVNTYSADYLKPGIKLGINIRYNFQLIVGASYYSFLPGVNSSNGDDTYKDKDWTYFYPNREGLSYEAGLRLQF